MLEILNNFKKRLLMNLIRQNIFGFVFVASLVIISIIINKILSFNNVLISSAFICILLGLFLGNTFDLSKKIDWFVNF